MPAVNHIEIQTFHCKVNKLFEISVKWLFHNPRIRAILDPPGRLSLPMSLQEEDGHIQSTTS